MSNDSEKYLKSIDKSLQSIDKSLARLSNAVDDPEERKSPVSSGLSASDIMQHIENEDQDSLTTVGDINDTEKNYRHG